MRFLITFFLSLSLLIADTVSVKSDDLETEFKVKEEKKSFDPLSGYNEIMTSVNDTFYEYLLKPTARGYTYVMPQMARNGVSNFFDNLMFPIRFANNLLQLKFYYAWQETERFILNSTMGILGFRDVAGEELGIKSHEEDLGQTLGHYGVGSGFHIVLPIFGPSNMRDTVGLFGDMWLNPMNYIKARDVNLVDNRREALALSALYNINRTSLHMNEYDNLKKDALELYPFLRDLYETRRNKLISE